MSYRRIVIVLATVLAGAALAIVPGAPASAAYPQCTRNTTRGSLENIVPIATSGSSNCVMGYGAQSSAVSALQLALQTCYNKYLGPSGVDGQFGSYTRTALRSVQTALGVTVDGVYGPQTYSRMKFASAVSPQASACRHV